MIVVEGPEFQTRLRGLKDHVVRGRIAARIARIPLGNLDHKSVGKGVIELRIPLGPGYRVYCTRRGSQLVVLPCGGDKASKSRDSARATTGERTGRLTLRVSDLKTFDAADYLGSPEAQAAFLSDAKESGDPREISMALNTVARARGMAPIAEAAELDRESLYKALGESGNPEFATIVKVLRAMGMRLSAVVTGA